MVGAGLVFRQVNFEIGLSLDLVKKIILLSSEDNNNLKRYYMQYSRQAHKILASPDQNSIFFCQKKVRFQEFFVGKIVLLPHFLLQISVPNFNPHNIHFLCRKTYVFQNLLSRNDVTVSNVVKVTIFHYLTLRGHIQPFPYLTLSGTQTTLPPAISTRPR